MQRKKIFWVILAGLLAFVALALVLAAFLPYGRLKSLADGLMPDGNYTSLKENNVLVFKILLAVTGLVLLALAVGIGTGQLKIIKTWFSRYFSDLSVFFKAFKPARV